MAFLTEPPEFPNKSIVRFSIGVLSRLKNSRFPLTFLNLINIRIIIIN